MTGNMDDHNPLTATALESELSKQVFHLKTLYDVSRELLGLVEVDAVLRNFLLMTLGNFGVVEGFVFLYDRNSENEEQMVCIGIPEKEHVQLKKKCTRLLTRNSDIRAIEFIADRHHLSLFPDFITCLSIFNVVHNCCGILGLGKKLVDAAYDDDDRHLLETLLNNLVIVLKNARATQALKSAYEEVSGLNRAKDKLLNHLSHELRTPVSLLKTALKLLKKSLSSLPKETWQRIYVRAENSLARLSEIQCGAEDIVLKKTYRQYPVVSGLLDQCADLLETLTAEQTGRTDIVAKMRRRIDRIYHTDEKFPERIHLGAYVRKEMAELQPVFENRRLNVSFQNSADPVVTLPDGILHTLFSALIKNAVENTPDLGRIDVSVRMNHQAAELTVQDFGVGIAAEHRRRIFEGFYPTQEVDAYATRHPFEFNAGGKGADLLRAKIFSERYHFKIDMTSARCRYLLNAGNPCPGNISQCPHCRNPKDCHASGFSSFRVTFPVEAP